MELGMLAKMQPMAMVLAAAVFVTTACGIKQPPLPPRPAIPAPITDLAYRLEGDMLTLNWTLSAAGDAAPAGMDSCRVYRAARSSAETECAGCPVRYQRAGEVAVPAAVTEPVRMRYSETVPPGFAYTYKVICRSKNGAAGGDSNLIKFEFPLHDLPDSGQGDAQ
jgi:hypothetical protein